MASITFKKMVGKSNPEIIVNGEPSIGAIRIKMLRVVAKIMFEAGPARAISMESRLGLSKL